MRRVDTPFREKGVANRNSVSPAPRGTSAPFEFAGADRTLVAMQESTWVRSLVAACCSCAFQTFS